MQERNSKLVVAVTSSVLFDLGESDRVFRQKGEEEYRNYQLQKLNIPFRKGIAFPFVRRLLSLNDAFLEEKPIEVILMSKNSVETGLRVFSSIDHYGLDITRACFSSGRENIQYLAAYDTTFCLSAYPDAVQRAIDSGKPAGLVKGSDVIDDPDDNELRIAFDFDGVIADGSAEWIFQNQGIEAFQRHEHENATRPLLPGPLSEFLRHISVLQDIERIRLQKNPAYKRTVRTAIITARNAPAHQRVVTTLADMRVNVDEVFLMGGRPKAPVLDIFKPHLFFDDQMGNLEGLRGIPSVYVPKPRCARPVGEEGAAT